MGTPKIGLIILFTFVAISLTFQYLVTTNKIKTSKISKIFYTDDESFIKSWGKTQERGMLKYIIKNIISMTFMTGIAGIVIILYQRSVYGFEQSQISQIFPDYLSMGVILGLINSFMWGKNQAKYSRLEEKITGKGNKE